MAQASKSDGDSTDLFSVGPDEEEEEKVAVSRSFLLGSSGRPSCSGRWLVMVDIHGHHLHLVNPITCSRLQLLTTTTTASFWKDYFVKCGLLAHNFVVSPGNTAVGGYFLVAFAGNESAIYCRRNGNEKWTRIARSPIDDPLERSMATLPCPMADGPHFVEQYARGREPLPVEVSNLEGKRPEEEVDKAGVVMMASWSDLPEDVLWSVAKLLHQGALFNFGCVCSSWRSVALQCRTVIPHALPRFYCLLSLQLPPYPPLLMLQSKEDGNRWDFYSIAEKKILSTVSLPGTKSMWVCGSSPKGWLAMAEVDRDELCLLNPISNARVPLPPASTMWEPRGAIDRGYHLDSTFFVNKIVDFSAIADGLIVALCDNMSRFYYCKVGDEKWSRVEESPIRVEDLIHYKGKFVAFSCDTGLMELDFSASTPTFKGLVSMGAMLSQNYIMESVEGELLLVKRYFMDLDDDDDNDHYGAAAAAGGGGGGVVHGGDDEYVAGDYDPTRIMRTSHFNVFKLDKRSEEDAVKEARYLIKDHTTGEKRYIVSEEQCEFKWVKIESIGDQIIFIGYTYSMAVPSHLFPHCKGNQIYFSDDDHSRNIERIDMIDTGFYDLEDGSIHYFHTDDQADPFISSAWIIPTPW